MSNTLALDTSTDACSACLRRSGTVKARYQVLPRKHNHLLFTMLDELIPEGDIGAVKLDMLAWAFGPGSFTGLRIAASAVQGLAYSLDLPVAGVSTLACMAQGALRQGLARQGDAVLVMLDARINEIYWGVYQFRAGLAQAVGEDRVSAPAELPENLLEGLEGAVAVGSGLCYHDELPARVRDGIGRRHAELWPDSRDLLPLADALAREGLLSDASGVQPVYLRNEIHWKKLSEQ